MKTLCGKTMSPTELAQAAIENAKINGVLDETKLVEQISQAIHTKYQQGLTDERIFQDRHRKLDVGDELLNISTSLSKNS